MGVYDIVVATRDLSKEELNGHFEVIDKYVTYAVATLLFNSNYVEWYMSEVCLSEIAAGGRSRSVYLYDKSRIANSVSTSELAAINRLLPMLRYLAFRPHSLDYTSKQTILDNIISANLSREALLSMLESFVVETEDAEELFDLALQNKICPGEFSYIDFAVLRHESACQHTVGMRKYIEGVLSDVRNIVNIIVGAYSKLVISAAYKIAPDRHDDAFQYGTLGLTAAIRYYCQAKDTSFASYAYFWIRESILYNIREDRCSIKLPSSVWLSDKQRSKLRKGQLDKVKQKIRLASPVSLDAPIYEDSKEALVDRYEYKSDDEGEMANNELVENMLECLDPEEHIVVCLRFGLFDLIKMRGNNGQS